MPARQVRVAARLGVEERRVFLQHLIGAVAVANPQLVLVLLAPAHRRGGAAHLQHQIVLVAAAHLAHREDAAPTALEAHEHRG